MLESVALSAPLIVAAISECRIIRLVVDLALPTKAKSYADVARSG